MIIAYILCVKEKEMKQKSRTTRLCDYNSDALELLNQLNLFMKLWRALMFDSRQKGAAQDPKPTKGWTEVVFDNFYLPLIAT